MDASGCAWAPLGEPGPLLGASGGPTYHNVPTGQQAKLINKCVLLIDFTTFWDGLGGALVLMGGPMETQGGAQLGPASTPSGRAWMMRQVL